MRVPCSGPVIIGRRTVMARKKSSSLVYVFALLLFAGGLGYMVWSGISSDKVYFLNVSEALAMPPEELQAARLFGTVAGADLSRGGDNLSVRFALQDAETPSQVVFVDYKGVIPDTFEAGAEVIVEGVMRPHGFEAKSLMTKCPSKYEKENRA